MIRLLDDLTINKIAAGEVVEGPYSIVKELVENAIDAGSSSITVEIKEGGKKYIRVTDNGIGIPEDDVEKAFLRHATSKIEKIKDLNSIQSLGFRGEALASIAAVAQVEMITKTQEQQYGVTIELNGGRLIGKKPIGCPTGTTIIVNNLFFNTPARLKFMKTTQGETSRITEIITRLALSKPNVAFRYVNNNNVMFTTLGDGNLSATILSVLQDVWLKSMINIDDEMNNLKIEGFIGQPSLYRGNRNYEIVFINGRYVKSKIISQAIELAYKEKLPINKYPICVLNLTIDPSYVDVNVHPMKTEVKFNDESDINNSIQKIISRGLSTRITIPELKVSPQGDNFNVKERIRNISSISTTNQPTEGIKEDKIEYNTNSNVGISTHINKETKDYENPDNDINLYDIAFKKLSEDEAILDDNHSVESVKEEVQENFIISLIEGIKVIGQLFNTYILLEKENSLYLIDQHAAHERLIYNKLLDECKRTMVTSQQLLEPRVINLSAEDYLIIINKLEKFNKLGFDIEEFGQNTIIIRSVPMVMGIPQNFNFFYDLIDDMKDATDKTLFEEKVIQRACKEAIKAKDKLNINEIDKLLVDLSTLTPPLTCPHGRPILISLTRYEIEKYFKRIQ
ncbi:DNA mismatch repair endonuclease MutL [Alkaliphilus peptidifermentans]|uniref:DNA mismatch repair protein MutL n=1 Tax=Alkaliphilus peptidifermentans DSM 18978 TaxID=1120976 RepID=A0A1G5KKJ4_9FIRM|nr:DNA mismatch repair endonuclease MutL [Alkaliphilus peptidifermentans]SCZ01132.1 DNA mismatch repair protein MutL [Alkaliphilus peptidifermentans DSM 18978]